MALILVIEDALLSRTVICKTLQKLGRRVIEANNGIKGLEMLFEHHPDCICLDLLMPELDGFQDRL